MMFERCVFGFRISALALRNMSAADAAKVCALVASSLSHRCDLIWYGDDNIVFGEYAGRESETERERRGP